jgi:hypothetical protein
MLQELGRKVLNDAFSDTAQIVERLARHPGPSVLYSHVSSSTCGPSLVDGIRAAAEFWSDWPDSHDPLLVVICITYARERSLLGSLGFRVSANRLRKRLDRLDCTDLNVRFKVLPELDGVRQDEVETWARDFLMKSGGSLKPVLHAIEDLYQRWSDQNGTEKIPMDELAGKLVGILERSHALNEEVA